MGILLFVFALFTAISAADADSGLCKLITCGKGTCNLTTYGLINLKIPRCECEAGWKKPSIGVALDFLPCVIPNCTLDASCSKKAPSLNSSSPGPSPADSTWYHHPCTFAVCGGGSCLKTTDYGYRCDCKAGYENLLNMTAAPCVRDCSIGADCSYLGISIGGGNGSSSQPPAQADKSGTTSPNNKGVEKSFPCQIAMAVLSLCVLLLPT